MFFKCKKLKEIDLSNFDTSNVTNIGRMFAKCYCLKNVKLNPIFAENVIDMN